MIILARKIWLKDVVRVKGLYSLWRTSDILYPGITLLLDILMSIGKAKVKRGKSEGEAKVKAG